MLQDVWIAGGETSATTLDWAMSELLKNPRVMKRAQAEVREVFDRIGKVDETAISEMNYLKLVVKETLRRICPGISYGLANVELPLAMLLYHFDWKLPNEMKSEDLDMTEAAGLAVRRKDELCVIPIPYRPSSI
ncbi:hypothetical protein Q3G72_000888 [Acer saccharum]|nr:hypothetical protein Q3G72_000888 [Acer saccharum]